jgi:hypothetical protein
MSGSKPRDTRAPNMLAYSPSDRQRRRLRAPVAELDYPMAVDIDWQRSGSESNRRPAAFASLVWTGRSHRSRRPRSGCAGCTTAPSGSATSGRRRSHDPEPLQPGLPYTACSCVGYARSSGPWTLLGEESCAVPLPVAQLATVGTRRSPASRRGAPGDLDPCRAHARSCGVSGRSGQMHCRDVMHYSGRERESSDGPRRLGSGTHG